MISIDPSREKYFFYNFQFHPTVEIPFKKRIFGSLVEAGHVLLYRSILIYILSDPERNGEYKYVQRDTRC